MEEKRKDLFTKNIFPRDKTLLLLTSIDNEELKKVECKEKENSNPPGNVHPLPAWVRVQRQVIVDHNVIENSVYLQVCLEVKQVHRVGEIQRHTEGHQLDAALSRAEVVEDVVVDDVFHFGQVDQIKVEKVAGEVEDDA